MSAVTYEAPPARRGSGGGGGGGAAGGGGARGGGGGGGGGGAMGGGTGTGMPAGRRDSGGGGGGAAGTGLVTSPARTTGVAAAGLSGGGGGGGGGGAAGGAAPSRITRSISSTGDRRSSAVADTTPIAVRLAACRADIESLKGAIEARKAVLQNGGLASVPAPRCGLATAPVRARTLSGHAGKVYALDWSRDSTRIISTAQDARLIMWNANLSLKLESLPLRVTWAMACAWSPDDTMLAWGGLDNICTIAESDNPENRRELRGHEGYVSCTRFTTDGNVLTASGDGTCVLWDIKRSVAAARFTDHAGDVLGVAPSPLSPAVFASCSTDETARVWDARDPRKATHVFGGHEGDVNVVRFMPSGHTIGTGGEDGTVKVWDLRSYSRINEMATSSILTSVAGLAFSASGRVAFAGHDDCNVYGWDALAESAAVPSYTLGGHSYRVSCVAVSPDGRALCSGSWDHSLVVWA